MEKWPTRAINFDLQMFAEPEPAPAEPTPTITDPVPSEPTPTEPPAPTDPTPNEPEPAPTQTIKIKFNHEERDIPYEEAIILAQKGMNYDKAVERAKQEAKDAFIASQGYTWNGQPIKTEAEYNQALREKEIYDSLQDKDLPPEVIEELVENRRFREQYHTEKQQADKEQRLISEVREFKESYPDVKDDEIPSEVFDLCQTRGVSLLDAYNRVMMPQRIAKLEQALNVQNTNTQNAATTPGSVTGNGNVPAGHFTQEQVKAMSQTEVTKNYDAIIESMKTWNK